MPTPLPENTLINIKKRSASPISRDQIRSNSRNSDSHSPIPNSDKELEGSTRTKDLLPNKKRKLSSDVEEDIIMLSKKSKKHKKKHKAKKKKHKSKYPLILTSVCCAE